MVVPTIILEAILMVAIPTILEDFEALTSEADLGVEIILGIHDFLVAITILVLGFLVLQDLMFLLVLSMAMMCLLVIFVPKEVTSPLIVFKGILLHQFCLLLSSAKFAGNLDTLHSNATTWLTFLIKGGHHHQISLP
ncbi:hypothetical protein ACFX1X_012126 [Malus domestica]